MGSSIYINKYKITSPSINRTQFPLMFSWACAVHKVQSLSLNRFGKTKAAQSRTDVCSS